MKLKIKTLRSCVRRHKYVENTRFRAINGKHASSEEWKREKNVDNSCEGFYDYYESIAMRVLDSTTTMNMSYHNKRIFMSFFLVTSATFWHFGVMRDKTLRICWYWYFLEKILLFIVLITTVWHMREFWFSPDFFTSWEIVHFLHILKRLCDLWMFVAQYSEYSVHFFIVKSLTFHYFLRISSSGATVVSWRVNNQEQLFVRWVNYIVNIV